MFVCFNLEIDLNPQLSDKSKPAAISDIFIDPTGRNCIISLYLKQGSAKEPLSNTVTGQDLGSRVPYENFYYNKKLHKLAKFNGLITAVGWNATASSDQSGSTSNILIGTSDGRIFETQLQPDDRFMASKELFVKQICELPDNGTGSQAAASSSGTSTSPIPSTVNEPICAINFFKLSNTRSTSATYCILVATSNFLYQFIGDIGSSLALSDSAYLYHIIQNPSNRLHKEMPGYLPASKLDLFYPPPVGDGSLIGPKSFGWLTSKFCFIRFTL